MDELALGSAVKWRAWLRAHHARSPGVFLRIAKEGSKGLSYAEALDGALAWGWIDSQKRALDDQAWLQRFTPRTAKSPWSKINRAKAQALLAAGTMEPPGLAEVERAKADGRWERAYDGARTSKVPEDLEAALAGNARARAYFATLDGANRYAILYRVQTAKKAETRRDRIAGFVELCARHETVHPRRAAKPGKMDAVSARRKPAPKPLVEARLARVLDAFAQVEGVTYGGAGFGSSALKVDGKIFAMIASQERFVVKLPAPRVADLIRLGKGAPFRAGGGRVMKEWIVLGVVPARWAAFAREAHRFVKGGGA